MYNNYLTNENISSKSKEWLSKLYISESRKKKFKFTPDSSALLVVDMQSFFLDENSHAFIPSALSIIPNINLLIDIYRKKNYPIIFTFHAFEENEDPGILGKWWGDVLRTTDPLCAIHPLVKKNNDDILIRKCRYSAFVKTNLEKILNEKNIDSLVITGILTHLCCETTARDAFMRDYEVYFAVDGTATDEESLHISSLKTLSDGFVFPKATGEIVKEVKSFV